MGLVGCWRGTVTGEGANLPEPSWSGDTNGDWVAFTLTSGTAAVAEEGLDFVNEVFKLIAVRSWAPTKGVFNKPGLGKKGHKEEVTRYETRGTCFPSFQAEVERVGGEIAAGKGVAGRKCLLGRIRIFGYGEGSSGSEASSDYR
ncbi:hypothetical protein MRB53_024467 [Persea americana]|uniref:Uncharacterized protein n=1 Tax=Persea americana TaxID=3435 RepID=A0ACC2LCG7_PERAE|nr:hypothetical protein MRB53_024467 [Persea americana]